MVRRRLPPAIASMMFEQIKAHSVPLKRAELTGDIHEKFMEDRKKEYQRVKTYSYHPKRIQQAFH